MFYARKKGQSISALPVGSDVNLFGNVEGVINFDTQVSDSAFNFGVTQQQLDSSKVSGAAIYQRSFCAPN